MASPPRSYFPGGAYHRDMPPVRQQDQDEILRRLEGAPRYNAWLFERIRPHASGRVLDTGAGIGTFTTLLANHADEVVAAEPDDAFAERLRERTQAMPNVSVVAATVAQLPEELRDFDTAICMNVLEHIRDDIEALRSLRDRLRPGGRLLLLVPAHPFLFGATDEALEHGRRYTLSSLTRALREAGFAVETVRHVNPVGSLGWLVSSRLLRRRLIPVRPLRLYDALVPVLRRLDTLRLPIGLSLWAVARRPL